MLQNALGPNQSQSICCGGSPQTNMCNRGVAVTGISLFTPSQQVSTLRQNSIQARQQAMRNKSFALNASSNKKDCKYVGNNYYMPNDAVGVL